jgi:hypothetical protein
MENVATYSEARSEYTKQLATFIVPSLVSWFQQLWSRNANNKQQCLSLFQTDCEEIARWNQDRIHDEVRVLIERTGCDYMEDLMTAVFIAHTKVLTAVRLSQKQKKLSITVPKLDHFVHRVFRESARSFWKSPFLFMDVGAVVDRQKNVLQIEALAAEAITTAVRGLLPVKQILQDYLEDDGQEEIEDEVVPAPEAASDEKEEEVTAPEKKGETPVPVPASASASASATPDTKKEEGAPAVVKIDTEPSVKFSEYDAVFDENDGAPKMRYAPKDSDDDDDLSDVPADGTLDVDEASVKPLDESDMEDLDSVGPKVVPPVPAPADEEIDAEVLE